MFRILPVFRYVCASLSIGILLSHAFQILTLACVMRSRFMMTTPLLWSVVSKADLFRFLVVSLSMADTVVVGCFDLRWFLLLLSYRALAFSLRPRV